MDIMFQSYQDLLRKTGSFYQVGGVRRFAYTEGNAKTTNAFEVKTGTGLRFTVLEDRCMDLFELEYKGVNIPFFYKNGLTNPARVSFVPDEYLKQGSGGMFYTSGLINSGPPNVDDGEYHSLHGRIHSTTAEEAYGISNYNPETGDFDITLGGKMRESCLFRHTLVLNRTIKTKLGSNTVQIDDVVENRDAKPVEFSILYHANLGYPFLQEGAYLVLPQSTITEARDPISQAAFNEWDKVTAPIDDAHEHLFYHTPPADADGYCHAMVVSPRSGLAVYYRYQKESQPYMLEWKSMGSGDYTMAIMPSTGQIRGRHEERENGTMKKLEGFECGRFGFELTILDDQDQIARLEKMIRNL